MQRLEVHVLNKLKYVEDVLPTHSMWTQKGQANLPDAQLTDESTGFCGANKAAPEIHLQRSRSRQR